MAKNLKLNVKNAQLAEALKIGKVTKPIAPSKKKKEEPAKEEEVKTAAPSPPIVHAKKEEAPSIKEVVKETPAKELKEEPDVETPPPPASPPPRTSYERPAARPHAAPSTYRTPQPSAPYRSTGPRPPYRSQGPGGPGAPYRSQGPGGPGARPPYRPGGPPGTGQGAGAGAGGPRREYRTYEPRRPFTPRPLLPRQAPAAAPPASPKGGKEEKPRKAPFKEYRDVKPQKKLEQGKAFDSRDRQGLRVSDDEAWRKRRPSNKMRTQEEEEAIIRPKTLSVRLPISVKDLASAMKLKASQLISKLFMQGLVITLNDLLADETTVQLLGQEFECNITIDKTEEERIRITDKTIKQEVQETPPASLILRPPVVTFMGHVDHGKTSLIDTIRKTNLAAGEAGAITQHIGAFKCHTAVGDITILDTPGHEAFSAMRTRGAEVTDIVVLVIAGDEGMRTQTLEAIEQARAANVPIVVAINKADKPNFNADNIYKQLAEQNLLPEVWGGTTITVNCSAVTKAGIKELLEMLALQAEILELKANPHTRARGTVIESEMHKGMGHVATLLVQNGTLRLGDALVFDQQWARVKTMQDEHGKEMSEAGPSSPVKITGLSGLTEAGSEYIAVKNEKEAREVSYERTEGKRHALLHAKRGPLEGLLQKDKERKEKKILPLILRADVQGSLDALKNSLLKIPSTKVEINVISSDVGDISESDIELAAASKATILGFHTKIASHAEPLIKQTKVRVKVHDIIYHAVDDVKELMLGLLDKIPQETDTGSALVKATFKASQLGLIAGCQVIEGTIKRNNHIRVMRNGEQVWKGPIASLKRVKEDVREVTKGIECGILIHNFNDVKEGDVLQAFEITYLQQQL